MVLVVVVVLSVRVLVTAWPRRARVCLMLVALEQSNDCGPVSFLLRCSHSLGNLLIMHMRWSAARTVRSSTRTSTIDVRVLLESSVARVLLSVAVLLLLLLLSALACS